MSRTRFAPKVGCCCTQPGGWGIAHLWLIRAAAGQGHYRIGCLTASQLFPGCLCKPGCRVRAARGRDGESVVRVIAKSLIWLGGKFSQA